MAGSPINADLWLSDYLTPWDLYAHGITRILTYKQTPYQQMYVVETNTYGKALVLDGKLQSTTGDEFLYHEPLVHPAMIYHGEPRTVLILGGGEGATLREVLRWKTVEKVMMIDIDGEVVEACRQYLPEMSANTFDDPRVELIIGDAFEYLNKIEHPWDVIISDLSEPVESGPSFRLFTQEYYQKLRSLLTPRGVLGVQAGSACVLRMKFHVRLARTLNEVFSSIHSYSSNVPSFGEAWGFILASENPINSQPNPEEIDRLLAKKTTQDFRMLDGITLLGILQTPAHIRTRIAKETQTYTLAHPPTDFEENLLG
ncbi:spermidine synthase [Limnoraphis robusta Tam1]|uniref:spermine/spermidine synthase domain-containing protein n=1 Tax=Limnoraphis robusta TaxID=1118279 RepID=UPI002B1FF2C7|nr:spermidine synthase [Limnoraphis robusta]MEA5539479.1 spermidine synthase [Limnoraphis robusta Tam1]